VVKKGEKVIVEVPVHVSGGSFSGTIVTVEVATIKLEVEATHIPQNLVVSVEGLHDGTHILAGDVELREGATLADEADLLLIAVTTPAAEVADDDAEEAGDTPVAATPAAE